MTRSGKVLHQLKVASNYSKLAFHKDGPRSFKRGQGALLKVAYKFGKKGTISFRKLCKTLGWDCDEVRDTAKIAQENGYITLGKTKKGKNAVCLTAKGVEVVEKRLAAEDRAADEIMRDVTDEEREALLAITGKIIANCQAMGVDYRVIRVKPNGSRKAHIAEWGGGHGHAGHRKHGHHDDHKHEGRKGEGHGKKCSGHGKKHGDGCGKGKGHGKGAKADRGYKPCKSYKHCDEKGSRCCHVKRANRKK